jgi:transposase InsO family protein
LRSSTRTTAIAACVFWCGEGGEAANHKRVHRLYREAELSLRRKKRRHLVRHRAVFPKVQASNEEWALDFVADALASHRHLRILSVVDVFTRECLALETDTVTDHPSDESTAQQIREAFPWEVILTAL